LYGDEKMVRKKWKTPKKRETERKIRGKIRGIKEETAPVVKGLKIRILALILLVLASSLGLWFAEFQPAAFLLWLLIVLAGGYAVFEFELFVSKVFIIVSALIMEFLVLDAVPNLLVFGSPGNLMAVTFGFLDIVLIVALAKL